MCAVSMIMDHYSEKWDPRKSGQAPPNQLPPYIPFQVEPTHDVRPDIEQLRKEVLEMKELLKKAIKYDKDNNQPDCEKPEKLAALRKIADLVGVDLDEVFRDAKQE